jgi:hypothetical protein
VRLPSVVCTLDPQVEALVEVAFEELGVVYGALEQAGAERLAEDYGPAGVCLRLRVDAERFDSLVAVVQDRTGGRRTVQRAPPRAAEA